MTPGPQEHLVRSPLRVQMVARPLRRLGLRRWWRQRRWGALGDGVASADRGVRPPSLRSLWRAHGTVIGVSATVAVTRTLGVWSR